MARMTLRARLSGESSPSPLPETELSPLALRLCGALRHIGGADDRLAMVTRGFEKHLRKHPLEDEEIREGLTMVRNMVDAVLEG